MQPDDVYKLMFQAIMGNGHAIDNTEHVLSRLTSEIQGMGVGPSEPLIDPISPSGSVIRVHLRPFLAAGLDPLNLANAFIESSRLLRCDPESLRHVWTRFMDDSASGHAVFRFEDLESLNRFVTANNFPAIHHSSMFNEQYRPAYRVVAAALYMPK